MIFTETCYSSRLLALMLRNLGFEAIFINGKMIESGLLDLIFSQNLFYLFSYINISVL